LNYAPLVWTYQKNKNKKLHTSKAFGVSCYPKNGPKGLAHHPLYKQT
jgi:hypothetical protein